MKSARPIFKGIILIFILTLPVLGYYFGYKNATERWKSQLNEPLDTLYATYNDNKIYAKDVEPALRTQLLALKRSEYALKKQAVLDHIQRMGVDSLKADPTKVNFDENDFKKFLKERNIDFNKLNAQSQNDVKNNYQIFRARIIENAELKNNVKWFIPVHFLEKKEVSGESFLPNLGDAKAKNKVVLFTNFFCFQCQESLKKLKFAIENYSNDLSIELRFSLEEAESSLIYQTAVGARCAADVGKLQQYLDLFIEEVPQSFDKLYSAISEIQIDEIQFKKCLENNKYQQLVRADIEVARSLGISPRSVFFVNGFQFYGQDPLDQFVGLLFQK